MEGLEQKLIELIGRAEEAGSKFAPEVLDALVRAAHVEGIVGLVIGLTMLPITAVAFAVMFVLIKKLGKDNIDDCIPVIMVSGIVGLSAGAAAMAHLLSSAVWLKLVDPVAYIAKTLLM